MKRGFSLIELLIVLVVLGTLMAWLLPRYLHQVKEEHQTQQTVLEQARALQGTLNNRSQQQQIQIDRLEQTLQKASQRRTKAPKQ